MDEKISDEEWIVWQGGMIEQLTRERDEARAVAQELWAVAVGDFEGRRGLPEWMREMLARHPWLKEKADG